MTKKKCKREKVQWEMITMMMMRREVKWAVKGLRYVTFQDDVAICIIGVIAGIPGAV